MKILLTGCAGFIGARTAAMLLGRGNEVVGIDNLNDYYDIRLKHHRLQGLSARQGFSFHKIDIEDRDALCGIFASGGFDAVVNLAARAGVRASIENPRVYLTTNTQGTLNLLELMVQHNVGQFVMASTSSLYAGAKMPFVETADVTNPISPYAATKLAAEALARTWHHLHGTNVAILRYFTVYGPAGRPDMSPFRFAEWIRRGQPIKLFGDGRQSRDFTYVDDVASATVASLAVEGCEVVNIGGGNQPFSLKSTIEVIARELSKKPVIEYLPPNPADMQDTSADISKAARLLRWKPEIPPEEGLRRTAAWHLENSQWLDEINL